MITMKDVAQRAGVSVSSVSLVLNGKSDGRVNPDVAEKIKKTASTLNYHTSRLARSLKTRRSMIIGLISDVVSTSPYAGGIILGAQDAARCNGYVLLTASTSNHADLEQREIQTMRGYETDGYLLARMSDCVTDVPEGLRDQKVVVVDARDRRGIFPSISPDEYQMGEDALSRLAHAGAKTIAYFGTPAPLVAQQERLDSARRVAKKLGLDLPDDLIINVDEGESADEGARLLFERAQTHGGVDGIVCFNDIRAVYLYRAARDAGIEVGRDVSIVSIDNNQLLSQVFSPKLTSIELPHYEMGYWAVLRLIADLGTVDNADLEAQANELSQQSQYAQLPSIKLQDARIHCRLVEKGSVATH